MEPSRQISGMEDVRRLLRKALEIAGDCDDPLIAAQIGQVFGHVCVRLRLYRSGEGTTGKEDVLRPVSITAASSAWSGQSGMLQELIIEALALADNMREDRAAIALNEALIRISGRGIMPRWL